MENLALLYRPQKYADIVGQSHVVTILEAMHEKEYVPTGMLFEGSRGTGKTSTARIYAKYLNCEGSTRPCDVCSFCVSISKEMSPSVIEIDAASHGLIEDVRNIIERSRYGHGGNYRIWIIDEAHGLSSAANNALLHVLEEPPPKTCFILVTTEPEKLMDTVRSRLMPFEFRRISKIEIGKRLMFICKKEGIVVTLGALNAIAEYVNGGLRDAIVIIEQLKFYKGRIELEDFEELFGVVKDADFDTVLNCLLDGEHKKGLENIKKAFGRSGEGKHFLKGFAGYFIRMMVYKKGIDCEMKSCAINRIDLPFVLNAIDEFWSLMIKTRYSGEFYEVLPSVVYMKLLHLLGGVQIDGVKEVSQKSADEVLTSLGSNL